MAQRHAEEMALSELQEGGTQHATCKRGHMRPKSLHERWAMWNKQMDTHINRLLVETSQLAECAEAPQHIRSIASKICNYTASK